MNLPSGQALDDADCQACEEISGNYAHHGSCKDVAEVVLTDKDAADGYEWRPCEHPCRI